MFCLFNYVLATLIATIRSVTATLCIDAHEQSLKISVPLASSAPSMRAATAMMW